MKKLLLIVTLALLGMGQQEFCAQIIRVDQVNADTLTPCLKPEVFELVVTNTSATVTANNLNVMPQFPSKGVTFVGLVSGASLISNDPHNPVFGIAQLLPNQTDTIRYLLEADCDVIADYNGTPIVNTGNVTYLQSSGGSGSDVFQSSVGYRIFYAQLSLNITTVGNPNIGNIGGIKAPFNFNYRQFEIKNSGGSLDTVYIRIKPENEISYLNFYSDYSGLPVPFTYDALNNEILIMLTGSDLTDVCSNSGVNDTLFERDEVIIINEAFEIVSCANANETFYYAEWGCNGQICNAGDNNAEKTQNLTVNDNNPNIVLKTGNKTDVANYCGKDDTLKFYIINNQLNPNDFATNMHIDLISYMGNNGTLYPTDFSLLDLRIDGYKVDTTVIYTAETSPVINWFGAGSANSSPGFRFDLTNNKNPNFGHDIDGDGFYDDLAGNDTLVLTAIIHYNNPPFSNDCPLKFIHMYGFAQVQYSSACGQSIEKVSGYDQSAVYNASLQQNSPSTIDASTDMIEYQPETFTFCTGNFVSNLPFLDCPVDSSFAYVFLPDGYRLSGTGSIWTSDYVNSGYGIPVLNLPITDLGDTLIIEIGHTPTSINRWEGCLTLDLEMQCEYTASGVIGNTSTVSWEMDYKCAGCDIMQRRACTSIEIVNHAHCRDTCDIGVLTSSFVSKRTTLGWTDETRSTYVNPLDPNINLNAVYPYDTIHTVTSGVTINTNFDNLIVKVSTGYSAEIFNWASGVFNVYDNTGTLVASCPVLSPPTAVNTSPGFVYIFNLGSASSSVCVNAMQAGYTVKLENDWEIKMITNIPFLYHVDNFRSGFYAIKNGTEYFCDDYGADLTMYRPRTYLFPTSTAGLGCNATEVGLEWQNVGGIQGNFGEDFPYEFRNIGRLKDTIKFEMPVGYTYQAGSATTIVVSGYNMGIPIYSRVPVNPLNVYTVGNTLYLVNTWLLVDEIPTNFTQKLNQLLKFNILPDCERNDTVRTLMEYDYHIYDYSLNSPVWSNKTQFSDPPYDTPTNSNVRFIDYLPNLFIKDIKVTDDGKKKTVDWIIQICNFADATHPATTLGKAENVWFDLEELTSNYGDINITSVVEFSPPSGVTPTYYTNSNGDLSAFVMINDVNVGQCRNFRIRGNYTNCLTNDDDSVRVQSGWNCGGYPDPNELDAASCHTDTSYLKITYQNASLQTLVFEPQGTFDICDTIPYDLEIISTGTAYMYDLDLWLNLPNGVQIINATYHQLWNAIPKPFPATYTSGFAGSSPQIGWHLSNDLTELQADFGGLVGIDDTTKNSIRVHFDLVPSCDYNPAEGFLITSQGTTNCNDIITIPSPQLIHINGFNNLDSLAISYEAPDTMQCNTADTIHVTVTNLRDVPTISSGDSAILYIPNEFTFVSCSAPSFIDGSYTSAQKLVIPLGAPIPANGSRTFDVVVTTSDTSDCATFDFPMEAIYSGVGHCGDQFCPVTAVFDRDTAHIVVCCPDCDIIAEWVADSVCISDCCGSDTTCFRLVDQTTIGADYVHFWEFGDGASSTDPQPCHEYLAAGTYYACHTVTQISTGCKETFCDSVRVFDKPTGAIELLGCNPFCEGDTVYLIVNGTYTSIEWVELPSGTTVGTDDTLTVTHAGRYKAVLTNGVCISECLAIDLETVHVPDIDLPDTMLCRGDSILICIPHEFLSYNVSIEPINEPTNLLFYWTPPTDVSSIPVGDTCFWVKDTGTYIVRVSVKLPFGCCTCEGVDTLHIRYNDISVTVPDLILCEGTSGTLCATPSGGYPPYTYSWQPNGEITPCITVNTAGDYIVTVTDITGCMASDTGRVTIDLPPNAEFSFDDTICINSEYCFIPVQTAGTHYWEVADSNALVIATSNAITFCYTFPFVGTFSVTHVLTNNCGSDTVTHIIEVVPPVEACIVLIGTNPFCVGDTVCLTTNDPFNQITQVEWYLNDVLVFVGDMYCVTEPGTYRAVVTDNHGCISECMCIVLTQNPKPVLNLPPVVQLCANGTYTIDAGAGFDQYHWYRNGAPYSFGTSSITVNQFGYYSVEVTDSNGCKAIDTTFVSSLTPSFSITSTDIHVCIGETFTLSTLCNSNYTYSWARRGWRINGTNTGWGKIGLDTCILNRSYSDLFAGFVFDRTEFMVTITDNLTGCVYQATIMIYKDNCLEMLVIPNPVLGDEFTVVYDIMGSGYTTAHFDLRDMLGNVVATYPANVTLQEAILDVTNLANGSYRLTLVADGQTIDTKHVVIAR